MELSKAIHGHACLGVSGSGRPPGDMEELFEVGNASTTAEVNIHKVDAIGVNHYKVFVTSLQCWTVFSRCMA